MDTEIARKIQELGQLAQEQLAMLETLHPHDTAQIRQFEENTARASALIRYLQEKLALDGPETADSYDFFCAVVTHSEANGSEAAAILRACLPQMAALRGRTYKGN